MAIDLGNVRGPQGLQGERGEQGAKGADGATWLFGTEVPLEQGKDGDFYLKTDSFDIYKKHEGSWQLVGNIKGEKGEQGQQGIQGLPGEKGERGLQGEQGPAGEKGADGRTPTITFELIEGHLWVDVQ